MFNNIKLNKYRDLHVPQYKTHKFGFREANDLLISHVQTNFMLEILELLAPEYGTHYQHI